MEEILETIKNFKFIEEGQLAMSVETKDEAIEFLRFLIVFSCGYCKFIPQVNNIFNQALTLWLIKMREAGFSQKKINQLVLKFGYSLKTE